MNTERRDDRHVCHGNNRFRNSFHNGNGGMGAMKLRAVLIALALAGCAKDADQIGATYVSPYQYENFTCQQLSEEARRLSSRAAQAAGVQNEKASNDKVATTVGVIIFWPALFFIKGNDTVSSDLARMKGEMEAIEQVSVKKRCGIRFEHGPPPGA